MALRDLDSTYLGVSVDDADPQAIFDRMLTLAETRLPQWEARNGSLETVLMEATAVGVADLIYAANRVMGAMLEGLISLYGVTRDEGTPATGTVRLTLTGSPTTTIEEGTLFRIEDADSMLVATETVTVTGSTVDVAVATTDTGGYLNAITAGTACDPVVAVPHLANCVLHTDLNGGADAEDDLAFLSRAATRFARVTSSLVVPEHFTAYALEQPYVKRAVAVDQYDHDGGGAPGDDDGYLTVYVYGNGAALSASEKSELQTAMQAQCASILTMTVEDATPVSVAVTAAVTKATGYDDTELEAAIEDALASVWSWQTSGFGADVEPLDVQAVIESVPGVDSVTSLTLPSTTATVDFDEFAVIGTVTLTIT
jgi:uncharacterized phage protein gp47/JayE